MALTPTRLTWRILYQCRGGMKHAFAVTPSASALPAPCQRRLAETHSPERAPQQRPPPMTEFDVTIDLEGGTHVVGITRSSRVRGTETAVFAHDELMRALAL